MQLFPDISYLDSSDTSNLHCASKFNLTQLKVINLGCTDGEVGAISALAFKIGPLVF